jgi:hypothetical protein
LPIRNDYLRNVNLDNRVIGGRNIVRSLGLRILQPRLLMLTFVRLITCHLCRASPSSTRSPSLPLSSSSCGGGRGPRARRPRSDRLPIARTSLSLRFPSRLSPSFGFPSLSLYRAQWPIRTGAAFPPLCPRVRLPSKLHVMLLVSCTRAADARATDACLSGCDSDQGPSLGHVSRAGF